MQTNCPHCGARATLLPDGAVYCPSEQRVVAGEPDPEAAPPGRGLAPGRPGRPDGTQVADPVAEAHWRSTGRDVAASFGFFNLFLLVLVVVALGFAVAGVLVVVVL